MVLLVPRQIRMAGITGQVPYYGGRLTPAHTYAITHPDRTGTPLPPQPPPQPPRDPAATRAALDRLLADGVLTPDEHADLLQRVAS